MTIGDAIMPVGCDEDGCNEETIVEMEWILPDHGVPHYDHNKAKIERCLPFEGWTVNELGEDGHRHFCEACSDARADKETS